jgi:lysophospholipase L1-like esterase
VKFGEKEFGVSLSVVFAGDGLIASGRWSDWLGDYEVHNLGTSGHTTVEVLAGLDDIVAVAPDAVVLQAGTNDLGWRRSDEFIVRNLESILCLLRKRLPAARLLAVSVPPRETEFADIIRSINRHVRQFAPTQRAQFLDLWPALARPDGEIVDGFSPDRLHLNEEGYAAWLAELKPALEYLFERPPSSSAIPIQNA